MTDTIVSICRIERHRDPNICFFHTDIHDADDRALSRIDLYCPADNLGVTGESLSPKRAANDYNVRSSSLIILLRDPPAELQFQA